MCCRELSKPFDKHTVAALCWWLLCLGIKAPSNWKKAQLIKNTALIANSCNCYHCLPTEHSVTEADNNNAVVVDVDGS